MKHNRWIIEQVQGTGPVARGSGSRWTSPEKCHWSIVNAKWPQRNGRIIRDTLSTTKRHQRSAERHKQLQRDNNEEMQKSVWSFCTYRERRTKRRHRGPKGQKRQPQRDGGRPRRPAKWFKQKIRKQPRRDATEGAESFTCLCPGSSSQANGSYWFLLLMNYRGQSTVFLSPVS